MKTLLKKYAPLKWYICLLIILLATSIVGIVYVVYVNFYFCETLVYTGTPPFTWGVDEGWGTNVLFYLADAVFTWMMWLSMGLIFRALKNNSIVDNRFLNVQFPIAGAVLLIYSGFCTEVFKNQVLRTFEEHPAPFIYEGGEVSVVSLFFPLIIMSIVFLYIGIFQLRYIKKSKTQECCLNN